MTITVLDTQIAPDLRAGDVADKSAADEADRAGDDGPRNSSYGRVCQPLLRTCWPGREDNSGSDDGKSTKRPHWPRPCEIGDSQAHQDTWPELGTPAPAA